MSGLVLHATAVACAIDPDGPLVGVLLTGESGRGKSETALALIERCPFQRTQLVADDVVRISDHGGQLIAHPPDKGRGMIDARPVGAVRLCSKNAVRQTTLRLALRCEDANQPRWAEPGRLATADELGVDLPEAQAPAIDAIRPLIRALLAGHWPCNTVE